MTSPDPNDPLVQQIEALDTLIRERRKAEEAQLKKTRGIQVRPFITVMALGRLCERHRVIAMIDWVDGQLAVRLVPRDDLPVLGSDEG